MAPEFRGSGRGDTLLDYLGACSHLSFLDCTILQWCIRIIATLPPASNVVELTRDVRPVSDLSDAHD